MRFVLDATPLLGVRTGVGRYVGELLRHLPAALPASAELVATAFTLRGAGALASAVPAGVSAVHRPAPARGLQAVWSRSERPAVSLLAGRSDLFHGTNFVLPPPGRAAGVVTVHDLTYLRDPGAVSAASRRYRDLVPRSLARASVVCVPSRAVAEELCEAYPRLVSDPVVTPLGVSDAWMAATPATPARLGQLGLRPGYVICVGTVEPRKDLATAVAAVRLAHRRGVPDLPQLAIAGPAGWGPGLDLQGVPEGAVVRLGPLQDAELRGLVAAARALVSTSRYEGFGLPLLESLACGTAVLATDIAASREVLAGAEDLVGFFDVGDVEALAEAITALGPEGPDVGGRRRTHAAGWSWARTAETTVAAWLRALR